MLLPDAIEWEFVKHAAFSSHYHEVRRNNEFGIQREVVTKRDSAGFAKGKSKSFYYIDNDEREFTDLDVFCDAYNEKFNFCQDHPEYEIKYVRVVVKRNKMINPEINSL